jgi:mannose-6-phosphate isomerase-like protein (cupin superfamily)
MIDGGLMQPKGGIGYHFSLDHEDGFIIFDDDAGEYTINGHTARLKGPVGVPCPMRAAHGYYNPTDQPKVYINIWVSTKKGVTTTWDMGNNLVEPYPLEKKPAFFVADYDRAKLRPAPKYHGGTGAAQYRRVVPPEFFQTNWAYHDQLLLPSGASDGMHVHAGVEEIYFVIKGEGTATVNGESGSIKRFDAIPVYLDEPHSFAPNSGGELEFIVFGMAMQKGVLDTRVIQ